MRGSADKTVEIFHKWHASIPGNTSVSASPGRGVCGLLKRIKAETRAPAYWISAFRKVEVKGVVK